MHTSLCHRLTVFALVMLIAAMPAGKAAAVGTETTLVLRPHCLVGYAEDNRILEEGGDPEQIRCPSFSVEDPQTLKTPDLAVGDILDLDIIVENPDIKELTRIRTWLSYDPHVLHGDQISLSEGLPVITPGESDFAETEGYAKIEGSVEGGGLKDLQIFVARVQFTVLKSTPGGTVLNFFDVQSGGHTTAVTGTGDEEEHVINREPGVLHVVFIPEEETVVITEENAPPAAVGSASASSQSSSTATAAEELLTDGEACITDNQCRSSRCVSGICQGATPLPEQAVSQNTLTTVGSACQSNKDCQSGLCISNICIPSLDAQRQGGPAPVAAPAAVPTVADNSAFALLQIQNARVTTEGSSVYLGWEGLHSSQLKAYNIYYGTTTGRYIQRKTVEASVNSLAIRSLPVGTTYYFAVRAVNLADQESAFSQEVAVTVGDPKTSTAPLAAGSIPDDGPGKNPLQGSVAGNGGSVPGATGVPSIVLTLAALSAMIGTGFASRRQMIAIAETSRS